MNFSKLLLALSALLVPATTLLPSARPASAATTSAARARDDHSDFRKRFSEAMKLNSTKEMERLVRTKTDPAVAWIIETAEALSVKPTDELVERMEALKAAWQAAIETDFCKEMYEYFQLLDRNQREERWRLKNKYNKAAEKYHENTNGTRDGSTYGLLGIEFEGQSQQFERLGDKFHASQAWYLFGACYDEPQRKGDADLYKTYQGFQRCVDLRLEIGLKDALYIGAKNYADSLARKGYSGEKPDPGGPPGPGGAGPAAGPAVPGAAASGAAISAPMEFELWEDLLEIGRPMYYADTEYPIWNAFHMQAKGSSARITSMEKLSPTALRDGASTVALDTNNDGQGDQDIPITGNWEPVQFEIGEGDEKRPWALLATVGAEKDLYQGIETSLLPQGEYFTLYYVPAATMIGEIEGTKVRVFDDNVDGVYGSAPKSWHHTGMSEGHDHPELDAIYIDGEKRARPWSEFQQVGDKWYQLASAKGGKVLEATPVELETGTLTLKYSIKGDKPKWMIVRGTGRLENSYFDVSSGKVDVPAGTYELFYGEIRKGKKRSTAKTVILAGEETPSWSVEPGGEAVMDLGAPFGFDFVFERSGEHVTVVGKSVVVVGKAGERYERPWNCVAKPEVSWRKAGTKKGSKGEDMDQVLDQFAIGKYGWEATWAPLDVTVKLKGSPDEIEVQLYQKKHKLFGKVESDWKAE